MEQAAGYILKASVGTGIRGLMFSVIFVGSLAVKLFITAYAQKGIPILWEKAGPNRESQKKVPEMDYVGEHSE